MAIRVAARRFNNQLRPDQNLTYLSAVIGEKVTIEYDVYYELVAYSIDGSQIRFKPVPATVNTLDVDTLIHIPGGTFFNECKVGDTIKIPDYFNNDNNPGSNVGNRVILEILSGETARFDGPAFVDEAMGVQNGYIANVTPLRGVKYNWNLIDSGVDFTSLIDGEYQEAQTNEADATNIAGQVMTMIGEPGYKIGSVEIKGDGTPNEQQRFTIIHNTVITPFFLANQFTDILLRKKPSYFEAAACLKYVSRLRMGKNLNDPNSLVTIDIPSSDSNTGWFNENFNGKPTNYNIGNYLIMNAGTGQFIDNFKFGVDNHFNLFVYGPTGSFDPALTKVVVGFNYLPESEELYKNNGFAQHRNFLFDSLMVTVGTGEQLGDYAGSPMQVIKTIKVDYENSGSLQITGHIEFSDDAEDILKQGDFSRYALWVIVENQSLAPEDSDKTNLLIQIADVTEDLVTIDLIEAETVFLEHPYTDKAYGKTTLEMFPVDDVTAFTDFSIDYLGHENAGISIKRITPSLRLKHATNSDIVLETFNINTGNAPLIGLLPSVQNINFQQDRVFKREAGIRKTITVTRDFAADAGTLKNWDLAFPFMARWEYWLPLQNLGIAPADLFDPTLPNDGLNHFWERLSNVTGWTLYYDVTFNIEQNGVLFEQTFEYPLLMQDFETNPEWINNSIKSYDAGTNTEILNGADKYLYGYKDTKVVASFEKVGTQPDMENVAMALWIEPFEGLGSSDIRMISSEYFLISASWFRNDSINKLSLSKTGAVYTGTAYIDSTKLPKNKKFTIYARIYEKQGIPDPGSFIIQEDDFFILQEDGYKIFVE